MQNEGVAQLEAQLKYHGVDLEGAFDIKRVLRKDTVTYDTDTELYSGGINIFDQADKEKGLKYNADFRDTKRRRLLLGLHVFPTMAFKPSNVEKHEDNWARFLYDSKIQVLEENEKPAEEFFLFQLVNFKLRPILDATELLNCLAIESAIESEGQELPNPILFPPENKKTIQLIHPSGLTTAEAGVGNPQITGAIKAWGNEGIPNLTTAGSCYSLRIFADTIEWQVSK